MPLHVPGIALRPALPGSHPGKRVNDAYPFFKIAGSTGQSTVMHSLCDFSHQQGPGDFCRGITLHKPSPRRCTRGGLSAFSCMIFRARSRGAIARRSICRPKCVSGNEKRTASPGMSARCTIPDFASTLDALRCIRSRALMPTAFPNLLWKDNALSKRNFRNSLSGIEIDAVAEVSSIG